MTNVTLEKLSVTLADLFILILWPVTGDLVAKLSRNIPISLPGDSVVVMARNFCLILFWEVLLLVRLVALRLVACSMVAELDCYLLFLILTSKTMVSVSRRWVPMFSGYSLIFLFLILVALVATAGDMIVAFI